MFAAAAGDINEGMARREQSRAGPRTTHAQRTTLQAASRGSPSAHALLGRRASGGRRTGAPRGSALRCCPRQSLSSAAMPQRDHNISSRACGLWCANAHMHSVIRGRQSVVYEVEHRADEVGCTLVKLHRDVCIVLIYTEALCRQPQLGAASWRWTGGGLAVSWTGGCADAMVFVH